MLPNTARFPVLRARLPYDGRFAPPRALKEYLRSNGGKRAAQPSRHRLARVMAPTSSVSSCPMNWEAASALISRPKVSAAEWSYPRPLIRWHRVCPIAEVGHRRGTECSNGTGFEHPRSVGSSNLEALRWRLFERA